MHFLKNYHCGKYDLSMSEYYAFCDNKKLEQATLYSSELKEYKDQNLTFRDLNE